MPNSRAKGVAFEREVAKAFEAAGFTVRGLESGGDHFVVGSRYHSKVAGDGTLRNEYDGIVIHVECKRAERMKLPEWLRQQAKDAPPRTLRVLVFKQSRQPAYAVVPFDQYLQGLR